MKIQKLIYLFAVVVLSFSFMTGCGKKDSAGNKDDKKDDKKVAAINENTPFHLKYDMTSEKDNGTLDMYVKGKNVKFESVSKNKAKDANSTIFVKDGFVYMVMDLGEQKMGMKMDVSKDAAFQKDFGVLYGVKEMLKDYTKGGTEEIIGYKCDVYSKGEAKMWIYNDMILLKLVKDKRTMTALAFEPEAKVAADFFDPPKDIDFKSMDDLKNLGK